MVVYTAWVSKSAHDQGCRYIVDAYLYAVLGCGASLRSLTFYVTALTFNIGSTHSKQMGGCASKPVPPVEPPPAPPPAAPAAPAANSKQTQGSAAVVQNGTDVNLLPAAGTSPVSVLPPWVTAGGVGPSDAAHDSGNSNATNKGSNPAAEAVRLNLSEVRSTAVAHPVCCRMFRKVWVVFLDAFVVDLVCLVLQQGLRSCVLHPY